MKTDRKINEINLVDSWNGLEESTICRTCSHAGNRMWPTTVDDLIAHTNAGGKSEDLKCSPEKHEVTVTIKTGKPRKNVSVGDRTHMHANSCGQTVLPKCKSCTRFEPVRVRVPYVTNGSIYYVEDVSATGETIFVPKGRRKVQTAGGDTYTEEVEPQWWNATVGGHCKIPSAGIIKEGRRVFCDHQPKKIKMDNFACANCEFLEWTDESTIFEGVVNKNARLTRFERFDIMQKTEPSDVGRAIGMALWKKQTAPQGRITWHHAKIIEVSRRGGRRYFKVRFTEGKRKTLVLPEGGDMFEVHPDLNENFAAVMVRYPAHKKLGLDLPIRHKIRIWPELPAKKMTLPSRPPVLADKDCPACKPERSTQTKRNGKLLIRIEHAVPCYFHAKAPRTSALTGDVEFKHTCDRSKIEELAANAKMSVRQNPDGTFVAVDGNGALPEAYSTQVANATVFRMWLDTLKTSAQRLGGAEAVEQIQSQYSEIVSNLRVSKRSTAIRPSWLAESSIEGNKPYCSHPNGINFRKVWQDAFGSERVDRKFDEGDFNSTQVEEEWRAGLRSHNLTPQRLQEEMLATYMSHKWYNPVYGDILIPEELKVEKPETWTKVEIKGIAGMKDSDGQPVESVDKFLKALDEHVAVGKTDAAYGVDDTRYLTRRQQLFGYTMTKGRFGKRKGFDKTSMSSLDPDYIIFDYNPDEDEEYIYDAYYCPTCSAKQDQVSDQFNPTCDGCGSPLYRNQRSATFNPRVAGGIGAAIAPDSQRQQQQHRLWSQVCPNWVMRGSNPPIGIDDLEGSDEDEPVIKFWRNRGNSTRANLDFVVGTLTEFQKAENAKYIAALAEVEKARELHKEKNSGTTAQELERLFPTPNMAYYTERAAGSVAKMGGTAASE